MAHGDGVFEVGHPAVGVVPGNAEEGEGGGLLRWIRRARGRKRGRRTLLSRDPRPSMGRTSPSGKKAAAAGEGVWSEAKHRDE